MLDIIDGIKGWVDQKKKFVLATVIYTWGSSPRKVGSSMAISKDLEILGSVSGGCIEPSVIKAAEAVLKSGSPKMQHYGVNNDDAWAVGLTCGGKLGVFLQPFLNPEEEGPTIWEPLVNDVKKNLGGVMVSRLSGNLVSNEFISHDGSTTGYQFPIDVNSLGLRAYKQRKSQELELGEEKYFAHVFPRKSRLFIIGAAHLSVDLVKLGNMFDFETIVIEPRGIFTEQLKSEAKPDQLFEDWPQEVLPKFKFDQFTYAVTLTHDPKIDDQALKILLKSKIAYIGALGSQKSANKRRLRLEKAGFSEKEINRINGPVGVEINAQAPNEIALSIMAEIIRFKNAYL